jgi:hypothetical protein
LANPGWDWTPVPAPDGIAFQTPQFKKATTIVGPATLDLWTKADTPVEDFQASITEVRPAAKQKQYMTSGFLRSSNQVDQPDSTALFTDPTYLGYQSENLSPDTYTLVKIPIDPIAHTFRPGTELRVVISAPGGDRPIWAFDTLDNGQSASVGWRRRRGEPCRAYQPENNQTGG